MSLHFGCKSSILEMDKTISSTFGSDDGKLDLLTRPDTSNRCLPFYGFLSKFSAHC